MNTLRNIAFIDGQNLNYSTVDSKPSWKIGLVRFRTYLKEKYQVDEAYYFLGCIDDNYSELYDNIQRAGFILVFREHNSKFLSVKKGNVDTDIVFSVMKKLYKREKFNKIVLVSGDGDYYKMVKFLVEEDRLCKILMPVKARSSSLYRQIPTKYRDYLDKPEIKKKIELKQ
ncbi:NYN domain-containing protein [Candidatus Saccharibacteria bacterium]|nr:NYN domain-containing protein [Candidatus Saccharibacteria bacterium]